MRRLQVRFLSGVLNISDMNVYVVTQHKSMVFGVYSSEEEARNSVMSDFKKSEIKDERWITRPEADVCWSSHIECHHKDWDEVVTYDFECWESVLNDPYAEPIER
jgi:hypothetical protein